MIGKKEYQLRSSMLRKLIGETLGSEKEIVTDRKCVYNFGLGWEPTRRHFLIWDRDANRIVTSLRVVGEKGYLRHEDGGIYNHIIRSLDIPTLTTIHVRSNTLQESRDWAAACLGDGVGRATRDFLELQTTEIVPESLWKTSPMNFGTAILRQWQIAGTGEKRRRMTITYPQRVHNRTINIVFNEKEFGHEMDAWEIVKKMTTQLDWLFDDTRDHTYGYLAAEFADVMRYSTSQTVNSVSFMPNMVNQRVHRMTYNGDGGYQIVNATDAMERIDIDTY